MTFMFSEKKEKKKAWIVPRFLEYCRLSIESAGKAAVIIAVKGILKHVSTDFKPFCKVIQISAVSRHIFSHSFSLMFCTSKFSLKKSLCFFPDLISAVLSARCNVEAVFAFPVCRKPGRYSSDKIERQKKNEGKGAERYGKIIFERNNEG